MVSDRVKQPRDGALELRLAGRPGWGRPSMRAGPRGGCLGEVVWVQEPWSQTLEVLEAELGPELKVEFEALERDLVGEILVIPLKKLKAQKWRVNESSLAQFHIQVSCWFIWLCLIGFWLINWFALIWFLTRYCWSQTLEVSVGCFGACLEFQPKNVYNWACIMLRSLCNLGLQHRPCFCRNEPSCCRKGPANRHEHWVKQAV